MDVVTFTREHADKTYQRWAQGEVDEKQKRQHKRLFRFGHKLFGMLVCRKRELGVKPGVILDLVSFLEIIGNLGRSLFVCQITELEIPG